VQRPAQEQSDRSTLPEAATSITIRQLLTHTSGLIDYEDVIPAGTSRQLPDSVAHRAYGYSESTARHSWVRTDQSLTSAVLGDGGIYSSTEDLAKWDQALYGGGPLNTDSLRLAFTPVTQTDDPNGCCLASPPLRP
jgi:CubicO group peptidase (beta-lactamase class C family)